MGQGSSLSAPAVLPDPGSERRGAGRPRPRRVHGRRPRGLQRPQPLHPLPAHRGEPGTPRALLPPHRVIALPDPAPTFPKGYVLLPLLPQKKLRFRKVKPLARGHRNKCPRPLPHMTSQPRTTDHWGVRGCRQKYRGKEDQPHRDETQGSDKRHLHTVGTVQCIHLPPGIN